MTHTPPLYTAHDVPDLINSLPTLLGFRPRESLVAIATYGPRRRFGFCLRLDMPPAECADDVARLVMNHLGNHDAEGAIVIALTDAQDAALAVLDAIHNELDAHDETQLIVRARATDHKYWTDAPGDVVEGQAYEWSAHHVSIVAAVAAGREILPDREALMARYAAPTGTRCNWLLRGSKDMSIEVAAQLSRLSACEVAGVGMAVVGPILDRALAGELVSDGDWVRFNVWLSTVSVRDHVWQLITHERAAAMLAALSQACQRAVAPGEAAVLSLTAFAAWRVGDGASAMIVLERALRADPCYSMALLLMQILEVGMSPDAWDDCGHTRTSVRPNR